MMLEKISELFNKNIDTIGTIISCLGMISITVTGIVARYKMEKDEEEIIEENKKEQERLYLQSLNSTCNYSSKKYKK